MDIKSKVINFRLKGELVNELNALARRYGLTKSDVIRQALITYLEMLKNAGQIFSYNFKIKPNQLALSKRGNCTFIRFLNGMVLTLSCVSSGGVGPKPMDKLNVDGFTVGKFITRAALMNVISINSWPIAITASICVEMKPTGSDIIRGIRSEMVKLDLDQSILTLDTEENFQTEQTGLGVSVIGLAYESDLKIGTSRVGDLIIAVGKPCVGGEVLEGELRREIADLKDILFFLNSRHVHEIMPVDTQGIKGKAKLLAHSIGREVNFYENVEFDLKKPAGPATSVLVTVDKNRIKSFLKSLNKPYSIIGEIS